MEIFIARQPIFDLKQRVMGYELLYREDKDDRVATGNSDSMMSSQVIVDAVLGIGLANLAQGRTAFINFNKEMLIESAGDVLDPEKVVIELLETVPPDEEVVAACRDLVARGFRIAMDDFVFSEECLPLLELAHIVKLDALAYSMEELRQTVDQLRPYGKILLAEKVENSAVHAECVEMGFTLFQGFHYFRPETLTKKDLSTQSVAVIRLLNLLKDINATDRVILEAFRSDPSLSYKLLRMVNSAALGGRGIESLSHALRLLGRDPLYRWLSLLLVSGRSGDTEAQREMMKSALLRGRMCEMAGDELRGAVHRDLPTSETLFLVGLFSRLDTLLSMTMEDVLSQISLSQDVVDALVERTGKAGVILTAVEAYETADWGDAEEHFRSIGADPSIMPDIYLDAVAWAGNRMNIHDGVDAAA